METPILNNKNIYPDDTVLSQHLGKVKSVWDSFIELIRESYPTFTTEWRYYNDGKSWLFKITKKTKTVSWVSVYTNMFKTTFYFSDKAETLIIDSTLRNDLKEQYVNGKRYGKIRGITVEVKGTTDLRMIKKLIEIKEKIK
jgi:dTDP-4-dehydrorhamnose reductase